MTLIDVPHQWCIMDNSHGSRQVVRTSRLSCLTLGQNQANFHARMTQFNKPLAINEHEIFSPFFPPCKSADLLLILWPIFFVAATQQEPQLKPRTFKKSITRGAERAAGIAKAIPRPAQTRRSTSVGPCDSFNISRMEEARPSWDRTLPPAYEGEVCRTSDQACWSLAVKDFCAQFEFCPAPAEKPAFV